MTQQFNATDLFRRVAPEVAARFAFRMHPNIAAEREAEIANAMKPGRRVVPAERLPAGGKMQEVLEEQRRRRAKIPGLLANGKTTTEMAAILGVVQTTVWKDFRAMGLPFPKSRRVLEREREYRRRVDYVCCNPELSATQIAAIFDVARNTALRYIRDANK